MGDERATSSTAALAQPSPGPGHAEPSRRARRVRLIASVAVGCVVGAGVVLQAFAWAPGVTGSSREAADLAAVQRVVEQQESTGRTCTATPALTDVVIVQQGDGGDVQVLSFDQAIAATSTGRAHAVRYCS